jgi:hypothetical protein
VAPACPDVCVIEAETTAPKAAAATATVISEPERRSSMLFPPFFTLAHIPIGKPASTFPGHARLTLAHIPIGKPVSTFPGHARYCCSGSGS